MIDVPDDAKNLLETHSGSHIGIINILDELISNGEIRSYSVHWNAIFIYGNADMSVFVARNLEFERYYTSRVYRNRLKPIF